jgi:hypothetical protein
MREDPCNLYTGRQRIDKGRDKRIERESVRGGKRREEERKKTRERRREEERGDGPVIYQAINTNSINSTILPPLGGLN